jgi:Holliday junction resolvasome RuvABC endonuclease subunit
MVGMADAILIGIDPSSKKIAAVTFTASGFKPFEAVLAKQSGPDACERALQVGTYLGTQRPDASLKLAFIESPLVGRGGVRSTMVQSFTSGALQAALHQEGFRVTLVNQSSWKAKVIGSGKADKREVREAVRLRWPALYEAVQSSQDLIDASAIAIHGGRVTFGPGFMDEGRGVQRLVRSVLPS